MRKPDLYTDVVCPTLGACVICGMIASVVPQYLCFFIGGGMVILFLFLVGFICNSLVYNNRMHG